jgi:signal transduction histidine kinase
MSKTIDDFRKFYNPNVKKEKFNLLESIQNALKIINFSLKSSNIIVDIKVDDSLCVVGLANEFSQVVLNLLSNSKDIAIQRDIKKVKIRIFSKVHQDKIFIYIEDNCLGIDINLLDKIFNPYFTTQFNCGTGIGLYMSKTIIENKMEGRIYASNIDNSGIRFTIILKHI